MTVITDQPHTTFEEAPASPRRRQVIARYRVARAKRRAEGSKWADRFAAAGVTLAVLGIAAYAGIYAYDSLYKLAQRNAKYVPLPHWAPIGFEAALAVVVIWDIYLTWRGHPVWFLRWGSRVFITFSIAGNAMAGWPDPAGILFHLPAPIAFTMIVEAVRLVLIRNLKADQKEAGGKPQRDPIPLARWLNDPWRTYLFFRRWVMWNPENPDYLIQVGLEIKRMQALRALREHFERRITSKWMKGRNAWRRLAPDEFLYQLDRGIDIAATHQRVMTDYPPLVIKNPVGNDTSGGHGTRNRNGRGTRGQNGRGTTAQNASQNGARNASGNGPQNAGGGTAVPVAQNGTGAPAETLEAMALRVTEEYIRDHEGRMPDGYTFARLMHRAKASVTGPGSLYEKTKQTLGTGVAP